jgi:hypothetical protein
MRDLRPIIRLIASLCFGLSVLAAFSLLAIQMATHHFQGAAERTVRQVFADGAQARADLPYDAVCRRSDRDDERYWDCDPIAVRAERSLRSASCRGRGLLRILGRQWRCVARFADGATLTVDVSLGFGRPRVELFLPIREPDA